MFSRLSVTRVALAAVSVFAVSGMATMPASARSADAGPGSGMAPTHTQPANSLNGQSFAYAVPRNVPANGFEVTLPQPLSPSDVALYRKALQLQQEGEFSASDQMLARVSDNSLVGIVLAERYLSSHFINSRTELKSWWAKYANSPAAPAIYQLMQHKFPPGDLPAAPGFELLPEQTVYFRGTAQRYSAPDSRYWRQAFVNGLEAWKHGDIATAQTDFSQTAQIQNISNDERAASDFWAARAALRLQQPQLYINRLREAARNGNTFYGMLAARLLGQATLNSNTYTPLTEADVDAVDSLPDGHLAFALLQVGLVDEAQVALRMLWPQIQTTPGLNHAVMAVAIRAGLVDIAVTLANNGANSNEFAGVSLPMPNLQPQGGFSVNPALIYALTRTESGFNPNARSYVGARGLMQLMPRTAELMRRMDGISGSIDDPSTNLAMGQAYLKYLAGLPGIKNNLLAILASYNAGPNAAAAWYSSVSENSDPLLFIETIPNDQTRHFVLQVLADSWIYDAEIGMQPQSLNELAEGHFPTLPLFESGQPTLETADAQ